jgi:hypothetical protein
MTACSNRSIHSNPLIRWLHTTRPTHFTTDTHLSTRLKTEMRTHHGPHLHLMRILPSAGWQPPPLIMAGEFQRSASHHRAHVTSYTAHMFLLFTAIFCAAPCLSLRSDLPAFLVPLPLHTDFFVFQIRLASLCNQVSLLLACTTPLTLFSGTDYRNS